MITGNNFILKQFLYMFFNKINILIWPIQECMIAIETINQYCLIINQ